MEDNLAETIVAMIDELELVSKRKEELELQLAAVKAALNRPTTSNGEIRRRPGRPRKVPYAQPVPMEEFMAQLPPKTDGLAAQSD